MYHMLNLFVKYKLHGYGAARNQKPVSYELAVHKLRMKQRPIMKQMYLDCLKLSYEANPNLNLDQEMRNITDECHFCASLVVRDIMDEEKKTKA